MNAGRLIPSAFRVGCGMIARRSRKVMPLSIGVLAIFAASAQAVMCIGPQAHTVNAVAACKSVTFTWANFASSGSGNDGLNTPNWTVVFKPAVGSTATVHGTASFAGSSSSLTVAIPSGNGAVTASSAWSSGETRDETSNSQSTSLVITNCPLPTVAPVLPAASPAPPAPAATVTAVGPPTSTAGLESGALALSTDGSATATRTGAIRDRAILSGGSSPTGTIMFSLYLASDTTCSKVLGQVSASVSGDGTYLSPPVTPMSAGLYQWVATYSGDKNNSSLAGSCNDPTERSTVTYALCGGPQATLHGVKETVTESLAPYVPADGVKSVTFY